MSAQSVPVPDTTSEEEFDLFGPGPAPGTSERLVVAEPPPGREKFGAGLFCAEVCR